MTCLCMSVRMCVACMFTSVCMFNYMHDIVCVCVCVRLFVAYGVFIGAFVIVGMIVCVYGADGG